MTTFNCDVVLGQEYVDVQTGFKGTAIYVTFHQHMCERVALEAMKDGDLKAYEFDVARIAPAERPKEAVGSARPGGATKRVSRSARR